MNIKFFKNITDEDLAGGKGASLAKMYQNKFNIPNGYVIMSDIFDEFLIQNNIKDKIQKIINNCEIKDEKSLNKSSKDIIQIIDKCEIPDSIRREIIKNYKNLNCKYVAVRSSATSEDGKDHAWAGQLETFLNVNEENIIESIKKCWTSIFSPRAIFYRIKNNDKSDITVAVVVQKMIQSDSSGVVFSINPVSNDTNEIIIESVYGLGEAIVSGKVTPDTYYINKLNNTIKTKEIKIQESKLVKIQENNEWVNISNGNEQKIKDDNILELSKLVKKIETFYSFPVDIEYGIEKDNIYVLQCRPITTLKRNNLIKKITECGKWNFYVSRKFNWFVENTEIYATLKEYQEKLLGFELITQNYMCLNGDEYSLDIDFEVLCSKLDKYFKEDINFFEEFAKIEFDIVENVKEYLTYIRNKDLTVLSFEELDEEFEKFNSLYIKSFIPGMTRPEDYLVNRLEKELTENKYNKNEIENIFKNISTCPNYYPLSYSEEPLDLLKIALEIKNGNDSEELLNKHILKYSWIKGPLEFEDTAFTKEDYLDRLNNLVNTNIFEKIENIIRVRKNNDIQYQEVINKYKLSNKAIKLIKAIRDFIFLRTYTTEYSDHLFYVGKHTIFKEISNRTKILNEDLIMLNDKEILQIIKNKGNMDDKIKSTLEDRKKGFAIIWMDGKVQTVFGDESIKIQNEIAKIYKNSNENNNNKKIISGSIANMGKVTGTAKVLNKYEDIYKVEKGDIIVATMTTPDYISAMEKSAGFITDEGGITCHAAIISREFNVPCIVGTINGTKEIKDGQIIELDAYNGKIYIIE